MKNIYKALEGKQFTLYSATGGEMQLTSSESVFINEI